MSDKPERPATGAIDEGPREDWELSLDLDDWDAQFDALTEGASTTVADAERTPPAGVVEPMAAIAAEVGEVEVEVAEAGGVAEHMAEPVAPELFVDEVTLAVELEIGWSDEEAGDPSSRSAAVPGRSEVGMASAAPPPTHVSTASTASDGPTPTSRLPECLPPPRLHASDEASRSADDPTALAESRAFFEHRLAYATHPADRAGLACAAASCALALGDAEAARGHYQAALRDEPDCASALRGLRALALTRGDLREALIWLDRELALAEDEPGSHSALSVLRAELLRRLALAGEAGAADGSSHDVAAARAALASVLSAAEAERDNAPRAAWARIGLLELAMTRGDQCEQLLALAACTDDGRLGAALLVEAGRIAPSVEEALRCHREALLRDPDSLLAAAGLLRLASGQSVTSQSVSDERAACERLGRLAGGALGAAFARRAKTPARVSEGGHGAQAFEPGRVASWDTVTVVPAADATMEKPVAALPSDEVQPLLTAGQVGEAAAVLSWLASERRTAGERLAADLLGERATRLHLRAGAAIEAAAELRALRADTGSPLAARARQLFVEHATTLRSSASDSGLAGADSELAGVVAELAALATPRTRSELRADPLTAGLWLRHALAAFAQDPAAAQASLRRALALWPKHLPALVALDALGDRAEAARGWLRRLAQVEPSGSPQHSLVVGLGLRAASSLAAGDGHWAAARECLERALPEAGNAAPLIEERLLSLARESGDTASLVECLAACLPVGASGEARFAALLRLAELEEGLDAARAIDRWREALALRPESELAREGLERALLSDGRVAELDRLLVAEAETTSEVHRRAAAHLRLATLHERSAAEATASVTALDRVTVDGAALEHWQALLQLDPRNHQAIRAIERAAIVGRDAPALIALYEHLGLVAADGALAVAAILERASLCEQLGDDRRSDIEADLRQVLYKAPRCRPALRRLLSLVELAGEPRALAVLNDRLADDPPAEAPSSLSSALFRERAARAWEQLGEPREALARRMEALERGGAQATAIRELFGLAAGMGAWTEAADAAEMGGRCFRDGHDRLVALLALGAIADRMGDGERALSAFRGVLVERPEHREAVEYVLAGLQHLGDKSALADVLAAWAASEPDPALAAQAHLDAARIQRDLGETQLAERHLVAALALEPAHREALAELSDVQYQAGRWSEVAETLMRYVRVEHDPGALHRAWFGLGLIYAERLPDPSRAIACFGRVVKLRPDDREALTWLAQLCERQGDARNAREALSRLAQLALAEGPERRIPLLLRGALLDEKLGNPHAALDGLRQALALDPLHRHSVAALATFFERQGDAAAARVHLDASLQLLRQALVGAPSDPTLYRAAFRVFVLRRDLDAAWRAASLLVALGAASDEERAFLRERSEPSDDPRVGTRLVDPAIADLLFDAAIPPGFRHLFRLLDESLQKVFRGDIKRFGIERSGRLPKGHTACELAAQVAAELGMREPELYLTHAFPSLCAIEPGDPTAIVLGANLVAGDARGLRFFLARALVLAQAGLTVPLRMSPAELVLLVGAVVRQFVPDFVPRGLEAQQALIDEAARLGRIVPRKLHAELLPFALECAAPELDYREVALRLVQSGNRAGLLASGSVAASLAAVRKLGDETQTAALLRFIVSDELGALRRALGIAHT